VEEDDELREEERNIEEVDDQLYVYISQCILCNEPATDFYQAMPDNI